VNQESLNVNNYLEFNDEESNCPCKRAFNIDFTLIDLANPNSTNNNYTNNLNENSSTIFPHNENKSDCIQYGINDEYYNNDANVGNYNDIDIYNEINNIDKYDNYNNSNNIIYVNQLQSVVSNSNHRNFNDLNNLNNDNNSITNPLSNNQPIPFKRSPIKFKKNMRKKKITGKIFIINKINKNRPDKYNMNKKDGKMIFDCVILLLIYL